MRILEISLAVILAIRFRLILSSKRRWQNWSSIAALGVLLLHIGLEGYRWQMIPLYALTFGNALHALWFRPSARQSGSPLPGLRMSIGTLIMLGIAILPPFLLPIPQTPAPTGPYPVGTFSLMLVDESRPELYSNQSGDVRRIMVQFWYPADLNSMANPKPAPWMENVDIIGPAIASYLELPAYFLNHIKYAASHAYADAMLSSEMDSYPLLIFSHGWSGFRAQNSYQMEELASHGYVVAAPDHTYGSVMTVFPDGEAAPNNPQALPYDQDLTANEYHTIANRLVDQWAADLSFILDRLALDYSGIPLGMFSGRLDLQHVGALGHSTGGGAIVEFCSRDDRCAAGLGMDTYLKPVSKSVIASGLQQPFLYMFSENWPKTENMLLFDEFFANSHAEGYRMSIANTAHFDFSDLPAFSPLAPALGLKGSLNGDRALEIIRGYSLAFFDQQLRGENSSLLKGPSSGYPEVEFNKR
jgi:predicted dienelactone hydrolase